MHRIGIHQRMRWISAATSLLILGSIAGCIDPSMMGDLFPGLTDNRSPGNSSTNNTTNNTRNSPSSEKEKVPKPVISPSDREFTASVKVSISCSTSGATVYYTKDGSSPTSADRKYTGPFTLKSTTKIKARAYKSGWESSDVASASFKRKNSPSDGGSNNYNGAGNDPGGGGCGTLVNECIRVRDMETDIVISGATAKVTGNGVNLTSTTNSGGYASFNVPGCRTYTLTVSAPGYVTIRADLHVAATEKNMCTPVGFHRVANSGGSMTLCLRLYADNGQTITNAKVTVGGGTPGTPSYISRTGFTNSQGCVTFELPHFDHILATAVDPGRAVGDPKFLIGVWKPPAHWDEPPHYCVAWETDWMP